MKKFLLGFLPMLFVLLGAIPAQALTLQWDNPGAIVVQTKLNDASTNIDIDPTATQIELTEAKQYYIRPADGYKLKTCEVVSGEGTFNISNNGGQFVSVSQYFSGNTLKFTTEKMVSAGSITINVINGADKITGQLKNSDNKLSNNTPVIFQEGSKQVDITNYDNILYIGKANGAAIQSLFSVKLNDDPQTSSSTYYPQYNIPIRNGDKIDISVYDPENMPKTYTAKFTFKNGNQEVLKSVFNITGMATKFYDDLVADGWQEQYEENSRIRLNFNTDDYIINGIKVNDEAQEWNSEEDFQFIHTVTADATIEINATPRTYEEVTAQVYITDPDAVKFTNAYGEDAELLTLTEGTPASGVSMGSYAVPDGTRCYTLTGINPKTGTIFFSVNPGYYVKLAACANPEDKSATDANNITYLNAWDAQIGPFFLDVRKVENTAKAVIAYVGEESVARVQGYTAQGDVVPVNGLASTVMSAGYSEINFDPEYIDHFIVRIAGETEKTLYTYLDGTALTADDNGVFQNVKVKDGALLKIFLGDAAPENNRVNFTVAEGLDATVVYDKIKQHTDLSQPLVSRGTTLVEITPNQPCVVKVAGNELTAGEGGVYSFKTAGLTTKVELSKMPVAPLEVKSTTPAEGAEVKTFSTATVAFAMPNDNFVLVDADKVNTITLATPDNGSVAATGCEMNGEPSESAGMPYGISFPEQTVEGKYTLTIPAGIFFEAEWSDTAGDYGDFVAKAGGSVNDEIVVHFTINASAAGPFDKYVMTPADGSTVRSIKTINVTFPNVTSMMPADVEPMPAITLSNGTTTYTGSAMTSWDSYPVINSFNVSFVDGNGDDVTIKEAGEWTLTIGAGLYATETETSGEVKGTFTVDANAPISWTADPANGSKQDMPYDDYIMVTMNFDADAVSYTSKDAMAGIRVKYRDADVDRLDDITAEGSKGYMLYDNYGEPQVIFAFNRSVFEGPGVLTIEADGGAFTVNADEASPEINYSVTFGDVKEYTYLFTPAADSEVESIKEFTLEFPEATTATFNEENSYIIMRSSSWIYPTNPTITAVDGAEHPTFKIVFDLIGEDITPAAGSYNLRIGEGSFILDDNQQSPEISASWTLKRTTPVDLTWTAEPVRDFVNEGYGVYPAFMFSESERLTMNNGSDAKIIVKFNDIVINEGYGSDTEMNYSTSIEPSMPNTIMFNISGGILNNPETEGKLTITIESGALLVSGEPCPQMEYSWNLVKKKEYEVKVTPAENSTVKELKDFTIEFVGAKTAEVNYETGIAVRSTDYKYTGAVDKIEVDNSGENAKVNISLKEALTNAGTYMLQAYAMTFILDGCQMSEEIKVNYTVDPNASGINGIKADANGKYTVFNLAGIVVMRDADAADLRNLPNGLYIVNGRKVALRK